MYYHLDSFEIRCPNFNGTALLAWRSQGQHFLSQQDISHSARLRTRRYLCFVDSKAANWDNLVRWLKMFHAKTHGTRFAVMSLATASPWQAAATRMFAAVVLMRDVPWEEVMSRTLEPLKKLAEQQAGKTWSTNRFRRRDAAREFLGGVTKRAKGAKGAKGKLYPSTD